MTQLIETELARAIAAHAEADAAFIAHDFCKGHAAYMAVSKSEFLARRRVYHVEVALILAQLGFPAQAEAMLREDKDAVVAADFRGTLGENDTTLGALCVAHETLDEHTRLWRLADAMLDHYHAVTATEKMFAANAVARAREGLR